MQWGQFLNGMNQGFMQGQQYRAAAQQEQDRAYMAPYARYAGATEYMNQAQLAPYKLYGDQMEALMRGYRAPLEYNKLGHELDKSLYSFTQDKKLTPLFDYRTQQMLGDNINANQLRYANPDQPQLTIDAINRERAMYGLPPQFQAWEGTEPRSMATGMYGMAPQVFGSSVAAQGASYNSFQFPLQNVPNYSYSSQAPQARPPMRVTYIPPANANAPAASPAPAPALAPAPAQGAPVQGAPAQGAPAQGLPPMARAPSQAPMQPATTPYQPSVAQSISAARIAAAQAARAAAQAAPPSPSGHMTPQGYIPNGYMAPPGSTSIEPRPMTSQQLRQRQNAQGGY